MNYTFLFGISCNSGRDLAFGTRWPACVRVWSTAHVEATLHSVECFYIFCDFFCSSCPLPLFLFLFVICLMYNMILLRQGNAEMRRGTFLIWIDWRFVWMFKLSWFYPFNGICIVMKGARVCCFFWLSHEFGWLKYEAAD